MFNPLKRLGPFDKIGHTWLNSLIDFVVGRTTLKAGSGINISRVGNGPATISAFPQEGGDGAIWVRITGHSYSTTGIFQWVYNFVEVEKTGVAYTGWSTKTDGVTGLLRNVIEECNTSARVAANKPYGNGVHPAHLNNTGFSMRWIPEDVIVRAWPVKVTSTGETEWYCQYTNGICGSCP